MTPNTQSYVTIRGRVYKGDADPKVVHFNKSDALVKEDCMVEDKSGIIKFHIWEKYIDTIKDKGVYEMLSLLIRSYKEKTFLCTSKCTKIDSINDENVPDAKKSGEIDLIQVKEIAITRFELVKDVTKYFSCPNCKKKVEIIVAKSSIKCYSCNVRARTEDFTVQVSALLKFKVSEDGEEVWGTAFTGVMKAILEMTEVKQEANNDEIEECCLDIRNIILKCNETTKVIESIDQSVF